MPAFSPAVLLRGLLFSLASNAAVLFVLKFGLLIWPERLPANSQNIFWLASGVNVAGLLILGLRYWPVLLLNAFPAWLLVGEPPGLCAIGATTNALEALLAAWIVTGPGRFAGKFDQVRSVGALVAASFFAPLVNTLVIPAYFCAQGLLPWSEYGRALGNWNLSNGAAMLMLAPLLLALRGRDWSAGARWGERVAVAVVAAALCFLAFDAVFEGTGMNFAFIIFPAVIYTAVRFGIGETGVVLAIALLGIYSSLFLHARALPPGQTSETIWFVQAFCWVLAATGLFVAALSAERRRAERFALEETGRALEASLREERARLAALRYQINPHFLFNALNSVRAALPLSEAVPREMITELSSYLRSTLAHDDTDAIPLRDELRAVKDYLAIEKHRFGDALDVSFRIDPAAQGISVPIFILQPLVENAIRHGFESSRGDFHLRISASVLASHLDLEVANTGVWKPPGAGGGLGLDNIRRRLKSLYRERFFFEHAALDGWVRVRISLPLRPPDPE